MNSTIDGLVAAAEQEWLDVWTEGPTEPLGAGLPLGSDAPDLSLADETGATRLLSEFWADGPALIMFWRHFGCGCGTGRAALLRQELDTYQAAGLTPVVIAQGEPNARGRTGRSTNCRARSCAIRATTRPHSREVSTSSPAITQRGGFLNRADPGQGANRAPRAPAYSRFSGS